MIPPLGGARGNLWFQLLCPVHFVSAFAFNSQFLANNTLVSFPAHPSQGTLFNRRTSCGPPGTSPSQRHQPVGNGTTARQEAQASPSSPAHHHPLDLHQSHQDRIPPLGGAGGKLWVQRLCPNRFISIVAINSQMVANQALFLPIRFMAPLATISFFYQPSASPSSFFVACCGGCSIT